MYLCYYTYIYVYAVLFMFACLFHIYMCVHVFVQFYNNVVIRIIASADFKTFCNAYYGIDNENML